MENFNKIVFFDTETTGLRVPYIISLAYIVYQDRKRVGGDYIICNPDYPIDPGASKVNGFYNKQLLNYPLFDKLWKEIKGDFEDALWVGHNVSYDEKALLMSLKRYGLEVPNHRLCCTCDNAKKLIPKTRIKNYKLDTLCDYFDIHFENHHTATFDTVACLKIFNELVKLSDGNLIIK